MLTETNEMPHSTHMALPVLQPRVEGEPDATPVDAEDAAALPPRAGEGVQATHITPPATEGEATLGNVEEE
jgi:hypothetical protein